jgi:Na+/melibiose symporter-like transporter
MMLYLYVQQHQWIVTTLLCGVSLTLLFCLTYSALWRPREEETKSEIIKVEGPISFMKSFLSVVPWVLVLLALASATFTVITLVFRTCTPPNW